MCLLMSWTTSATELATSFVNVFVFNVPLGTPRRVEDSAGKGLMLYNKGDDPLSIHVEAVFPSAKELRSPAEPVPDTRWIQIQPENIEVPAHGRAEVQVIILVPNDKKYRSHLYQAMISSRAQSLAGQGVILSAGLKSRLTFKVADH